LSGAQSAQSRAGSARTSASSASRNEYYTDPFQNLAHRVTLGAGVGYDLIDRPNVEWNISIRYLEAAAMPAAALPIGAIKGARIVESA
jgi:hypothetical protein